MLLKRVGRNSISNLNRESDDLKFVQIPREASTDEMVLPKTKSSGRSEGPCLP